MKEQVVKIVNLHQVKFYEEKGIEPLYTYKGYKHKKVFVYRIDDTKTAFKEWRKRHIEYLESIAQQ